MGTAAAAHLPVMRDRVVELLAPALTPPGAVLVDATLGRAGHASALLAAHPRLSLIGIDTDATAIEESRVLLAAFGHRVLLVQAVYDELPEILARAGHAGVQGILFDLGVSSPQLDNPSRGFAYSQEAPLDMRMNQTGGLTAADVEETMGQAEVRQTFRASRIGTIAGCFITEGHVVRGARVRVVRDATVINETTIASLRRFNEDVREVSAGFECGIVLTNFPDVKEGDVFEAFETRKVERELG